MQLIDRFTCFDLVKDQPEIQDNSKNKHHRSLAQARTLRDRFDHTHISQQKWPPLIGQSIDDDKCFLHDERYALERSNETEETNPFA